MRIAIYSGEIPSTTFIEHLIRGVADAGHTVLVFGTEKGTVQYENSCVIQIPTPRNFIKMCFWTFWLRLKLRFKSVKDYQFLKKAIDGNTPKSWLSRAVMWGIYTPVVFHKPDLFHLQWVKGVEDWLFLQKIGIKVVASLRGTHVNTSPVADLSLANSYLRALPKVDRFHAVSNAISTKAQIYGAPANRIQVIYPAVKSEILYDPIKTVRSSGQCLRILSIGRDHWKKGYRYSLDACAELFRKGVAFEYTIVGGGGSESLAHQRDQLKLTKSVNLVGNVSHSDVMKLYEEADLFLLPSLEEGIANVVLESMAIGCPVISSDCGGMEEVIDDGINGFIFPVTQVDVLVQKIEYLMGLSASQIDKLRENARETIRANHLLGNQIKKMSSLYKEVMRGDESVH